MVGRSSSSSSKNSNNTRNKSSGEVNETAVTISEVPVTRTGTVIGTATDQVLRVVLSATVIESVSVSMIVIVIVIESVSGSVSVIGIAIGNAMVIVIVVDETIGATSSRQLR